MSNIFDRIQKAAFNIVTDTFGYDAKWQPSDLSEYATARVLFKEPTKEHELLGVEFTAFTYFCEYHKPFLPGLYESVAAGGSEKLTINEIEYYVRKVDAIWDGETYRAILEKIA